LAEVISDIRMIDILQRMNFLRIEELHKMEHIGGIIPYSVWG